LGFHLCAAAEVGWRRGGHVRGVPVRKRDETLDGAFVDEWGKLSAVARRDSNDTTRDFSDELEEWLRADGKKTLGELANAFEEKSFAVLIILLMFPSSLPIPTGGITHIFEALTLLLGLQMVIGLKSVWLPKRVRDRELGEATKGKAIPFMVKRIKFFERFSRPRLGFLFDQRWFLRILGLLIIFFTVGSVVAPPFSGLDTLPSLGVVIIGLAIVLNDIVVLGVGVLVGVGGMALIVTLGAAAARFVRGVF
jgi:hypothetical protein